MRKIVITTTKERNVPAEELYALRKEAFAQWKEKGLSTTAVDASVASFALYLKDKTVFVVHDAETDELLATRTLTLYPKKGRAAESNLSVAPKAKRQGIGTRLLEAEVEWLRKAGYRYTTCTTATTAVWSVRWHLKNGYRIVGYLRSEWNNYASYMFRKQFAYDLRHHPTDILWLPCVAPVTARLTYAATYLATHLCKTRTGKLNTLGRLAKHLRR
mgnify:CR=1 FL=1